MTVLVDGEASFTTRGTIKDDHPVPTTCTSKIVSNAETSDVTIVAPAGAVPGVGREYARKLGDRRQSVRSDSATRSNGC
jgi:hypothetical protein